MNKKHHTASLIRQAIQEVDHARTERPSDVFVYVSLDTINATTRHLENSKSIWPLVGHTNSALYNEYGYRIFRRDDQGAG